MKKSIRTVLRMRTILFMAVLAVLTVSCQKEIEGVKPVASIRRTIGINVNGLMGEYVPVTKSELVNSVRVAWEGGEKVFVYDGASCLGTLTASLDGTEDRYAILSGSIAAPASGNTLFLVHSPLLADGPAIADGKLSISLAGQTTDKAPFVVYATIGYTQGQTSIENLIVPFSFATSVVRVNCTGLKPNTAIGSADISNVNTSCVLSFANGTVTASGADEGTIARSNADGFGQTQVNAEGDASFQFAVPALSSSTGRALTIVQDGDEYVDENFSKASIGPNLSVNTICTMRNKDTITPDSPVGTIGTIAGRKAMVVNLYGAKYAVALSNEGATSESGTGSYGSYYGYSEATAFFHGSELNVWRVPSMDEMKALTDMPREYDSTTPALKFKTAGSSISFPLAGLCTSEGVSEIGHVYYYTSTLLESEEGDMVCFMDYRDGSPCVEYVASAAPDLFKLSLRLFYQLTETNTDVIHGRFTVNASGKQVYFSKGNLQATYNGSAYTWGFAPNQYDIIGAGNADIATPVNGTKLDLFGWSTASTNYGISASKDNADYYGDFVDWGKALGSNTWRTLSYDEWNYLINTRIVNDGTGFGKTYNWATIKVSEDVEIKGLVIFYDGYFHETDSENLDAIPAGCVFLPAAGRREIDYTSETAIKYAKGNLCYWSATPASKNQAHNIVSDLEYCSMGTSTRNFGYSIRLVTDCE